MSQKASKEQMFEAMRLLGSLPKAKGTPSDVLGEAYLIALDGVTALALDVAVRSILQSPQKFMPSPTELRQAVNRCEPRKDTQEKHRDPEVDTLTPGQKLGYPLLKDDPQGRSNSNALWAKVRPTFSGPGSQFEPADPTSRKKAKRLFKAMKTGHGATPAELREAGFPRHAEELERLGPSVIEPEPDEDDEAIDPRPAAIEREIAEAKIRDQQRHPKPSITEAEQMERIRQIGQEPTQPTEALLRSLRNPMNPPRE